MEQAPQIGRSMLTVVKDRFKAISHFSHVKERLTCDGQRAYEKASMVVYDHGGNRFFMMTRQPDGTFKCETHEGRR